MWKHGNFSFLNLQMRLTRTLTRRENSTKNYRACPHNERAKNISTEICRLRKEKLQCFSFSKRSLGIFEWEHEKISWTAPQNLIGLRLLTVRCAMLPERRLRECFTVVVCLYRERFRVSSCSAYIRHRNFSAHNPNFHDTLRRTTSENLWRGL